MGLYDHITTALDDAAEPKGKKGAVVKTARMRAGTEKEFNDAVANAGWPQPRRMSTKRTFDAFYSDRGTEVASKHQVLSRGKVVSETYMVNEDYLHGRVSSVGGQPFIFVPDSRIAASRPDPKSDPEGAMETVDEMMATVGQKLQEARRNYQDAMADARDAIDELDRAWKHWDWRRLVNIGVVSKADADYIRNVRSSLSW